ncbi:MAG: PKD domain-containing protein [Gemmatimonadota bacterium]
MWSKAFKLVTVAVFLVLVLSPDHGPAGEPAAVEEERVDPVTVIAVVGIAIAIVDVGLALGESGCNHNDLWVSDPDITLNTWGANDGLVVGDQFTIDVDVSGYAGIPGHTRKLTITARAGRAGSGWDWEREFVRDWKNGSGNFDMGVQFKGNNGEMFQAASTGNLDVEVKAKVEGSKGTFGCLWASGRSSTNPAGWYRKTWQVGSPFTHDASGPSPGAVLHYQTSTLSTTVTNRSEATLKGTHGIENKNSSYTLGKGGTSQPLSTQKWHQSGWPHFWTRTFYFSNVTAKPTISLRNGQTWSTIHNISDLSVNCGIFLDACEPADVDWGAPTWSGTGNPPEQEGMEVEFGFEQQSEPPDNTEFSWDFGDGGVTVPDPNAFALHTYADDHDYVATLTATWPDGAEGSASECIHVDIENANPRVLSMGVPDVLSVGEVAAFIATADDSVGSDPLTYMWYFGDGDSLAGASVSHSYADWGFYPYRLVVRDDEYGLRVKHGHLTVYGEPPVAVPGPGYSGDESSGIQFDGSASYDLDGEVIGWVWDFGDSATSQEEAPVHAYPEDGVYVASLRAIDDNGQLGDPVTTEVTVNDISPEFRRIHFDFETQYRVRHCANYNSVNPSDSLTYMWDFGDGDIGHGPYVEHTYPADDTYFVILTVDDGDSPVYFEKALDVPCDPDSVSYFTVEVAEDTVYIGVPDSTTCEITVTSFNEFTSPVDLTVSGLPTGSSGTFRNMHALFPHTWFDLAFETGEGVSEGEYPLTITGECDGKVSMDVCTLVVLPWTGADDETVLEGFKLVQNAPNPFSPDTEIEFVLPVGCDVNLAVYDAAGRRVGTLVDGYRQDGRHAVTWSAVDAGGRTLPNGVYLCKLEAGGHVVTRKMVLLR